MFKLSLSINLFILALVVPFAKLQGKKIEILAVRHAESMNNILSGSNSPSRFIKDLFSQRNKLKNVGGNPFKNPVLSHDGRVAARAINAMIFPTGTERHNLFSSEKPYHAVMVSPLHRTIQTGMLLFGNQMYKESIPFIPETNLSEYRKSISEDGGNFNYLKNIFEYEQTQLSKLNVNKEELAKNSFQNWQKDFITKAKKCCYGPWWPMGDDLKNKKEKESHLKERIRSLKENIVKLDKDKIILVSHGGFLRAFFFGIKDLKERNHLFKNLGFMKADLDTETGKLSNKRCWNPKTGRDDSYDSCLRKYPAKKKREEAHKK